jgi:hypothetical protein
VRGLVAGYKVPRSVWLTDQLSRTVSGKADYERARRHAAERPPDYPPAVPAARPPGDSGVPDTAAAGSVPAAGSPGAAAADPRQSDNSKKRRSALPGPTGTG